MLRINLRYNFMHFLDKNASLIGHFITDILDEKTYVSRCWFE